LPLLCTNFEKGPRNEQETNKSISTFSFSLLYFFLFFFSLHAYLCSLWNIIHISRYNVWKKIENKDLVSLKTSVRYSEESRDRNLLNCQAEPFRAGNLLRRDNMIQNGGTSVQHKSVVFSFLFEFLHYAVICICTTIAYIELLVWKK
jgi:hypothetical protein